jgi:hypothetical protein
MNRRLAEGRTRKEIIRCLKTYVARQAYRAITTDLDPPGTTHLQHPELAA